MKAKGSIFEAGCDSSLCKPRLQANASAYREIAEISFFAARMVVFSAHGVRQ
jgi:hypothetical protein